MTPKNAQINWPAPAYVCKVEDLFSTAVEITASSQLSHRTLPKRRTINQKSDIVAGPMPVDTGTISRRSISSPRSSDSETMPALSGRVDVEAKVFDFGGSWASSDDESSDGSSSGQATAHFRSQRSEDSDWVGKSSSYWDDLMQRRKQEKLQAEEKPARGRLSATFYLAK